MIDVIDRQGNMGSATAWGGLLWSSPIIPALGFALNTRLQITWLDERSPNRLQPGKRPCTTLSPSLALKHGEPWMVFGTPGGDQQDQWQAAFLLRHWPVPYTHLTLPTHSRVLLMECVVLV